MSTASCPLCASRKGRRSCPALNQIICPACCGTKRQTEIACPPSCAYLSSARAHPPAVQQRRHERDLRFILPLFSDLTEPQSRLLLMFQSIAVQHARTALPPLLDSDVAEAVSAAAATLETAGKGIIYEHQAASVPAQRLLGEFMDTIADLRQKSGSAARALEKDTVVVLRRLEHAARTAARALDGDEPPVYLRLARRMLDQMAEPASDHAQDEHPGLAPPEGSRLILP